MSEFWGYAEIGARHIMDPNGYDHIVFLLALIVTRSLKEWRSLLVLVTAFTLGHSITLVLSVMDIFTLPTDWIEFFIPITILATCVQNLFTWDNRKQQAKYLLTLFFGFIHGMGFSNQLKSILMGEEDLFTPLLGFNVGLELGQLVIVMVAMFAVFGLAKMLGVRKRDLVFVVSGAAGGIALVMALERIPW